MRNKNKKTAYFHLPGLFEFVELYRAFLPLFYEHREWFHDGFAIGSIYGAPAGALWGGGRVGFGEASAEEVLALTREYGISARLTFSNSLLTEEHLSDRTCNALCEMFAEGVSAAAAEKARNGVIVHSDMLCRYLKENYPSLYLVSSTTKVLTEFADLKKELDREEFDYVVPDFRLNKAFSLLEGLPQKEKDKAEFLVNECCDINCKERKACYENVSRKSLGDTSVDHICHGAHAAEGYRFSRTMENPAFISREDIQNIYLPMGFSNFKIEGRGLGSAVVLEFLLYYLTRPQWQLKVREEIYLDSCLDLF